MTETHERSSTRINMAEAIAVGLIWLAGLSCIGLIVANYHGDQQVSLENAIAYVVIGVVSTTLLVLYRGVIEDWIRSKM